MLFLKIYVLINTQGKCQPHLKGISAWVIFFLCCRTLESPALRGTHFAVTILNGYIYI
jgi:hypothetical protein